MFQSRVIDVGRSWSNWVRQGQQFFRAVIRGRSNETFRSSVGLTLDVSPTVGRSRILEACTTVRNQFFSSIYRNRLNTVVGELRSRYGFRYYSGNFSQFGKFVNGRGEASTKIRLSSYAFVAFGLAYMNPSGSNEDSLVSCDLKAIKNAATEARMEYSSNIDDYQIGAIIGKGCNSAVFAASLKTQSNLLPVIEEDLDSKSSSDTDDDTASTVTSTGDCSDIEIISTSDSEQNSEHEDKSLIIDFVTECLAQPSLDNTDDDSGASVNSDFEVIPDSRDVISEQSADGTTIVKVDGQSHDLAVKMLFNFSAESIEEAILMTMDRECVLIETKNSARRLPAHFNIIDIKVAIVGEVLSTGLLRKECPAVLPAKQHPGGFGRNKTLYLVMDRYPYTLDSFIHQYFHVASPSSVTSQVTSMTIVLTQLLESVLHMTNNNVAHRDLKTNNILVEPGGDYPRIVVTDFGCCNVGRLRSWYFTKEISKGGNACLMAPEIRNARPGLLSLLDFAKSDLWACGAIAYEILGAANPFYEPLPDGTLLDSGTYNDDQLPKLPDYVPAILQKIVQSLLRRNPAERPDPQTAANMVQLFLWAPREWFRMQPKAGEVISWLSNIMIEVLCTRKQQCNTVKWNLKKMFIERIQPRDIFTCLDCIYNCR